MDKLVLVCVAITTTAFPHRSRGGLFGTQQFRTK